MQERVYEGSIMLGGGASGARGGNKTGGAVQSLTRLESVPETISECSIVAGDGPTCMDADASAKITTALGVTTIDEAKTAVGCDSERCLVERAAQQIGHKNARAIIGRYFKIDGPTDASLLSNVNIDTTLEQWAEKFRDFYPYNFNMKNYTKYHYENGRVEDGPDTLATVNVGELYRKGVRTAACVINTDVYQGNGEHWMCLFVDMREPGKATVEFFNSAGGCPQVAWQNWLVKTKEELEAAGIADVQICGCSKIIHQSSMSECGVYSLYYIWSRLNGVTWRELSSVKIPDKLMFEFRQHLFTNPIIDGGKFDWDKYQKRVRIKWQ